MALELIPLAKDSPIMIAGQAADRAAALAVFANYRQKKSYNTTRSQDADLKLFADFLKSVGAPVEYLNTDPAAWQGITWGLVGAFLQWQGLNGYSVGSINRRLATVKTYAELALQAGALTIEAYSMVQTVKGYSQKEKANFDTQRRASGVETRRTTRARLTTKDGAPVENRKKTAAIFLTKEQREALLDQPGTQQGKRDRLILLLMLDHGLRVSEVIGLQRGDFTLPYLKFYRPKTNTTDIHTLTERTQQAVKTYLKIAPENGSIWRNSAMKNEGKQMRGKLTTQGLSPKSVYERVELLGRKIGIEGLSPHDLRHTFAERAKKSPAKVLQRAGGWNSEAMPLRYQKSGEIANEGLILED